MTPYLETSALVKLYVREAGSEVVRALLDAADHVATTSLAYPEARAALALRRREGALSAGELERACADLERDWPAFVAVELRASVVRAAGELAERHGLAAVSAVHLASALELALLTDRPVRFASFDPALSRAASAEGLQV